MSDVKTGNMADRVHERLFPAHRGAIRIAGERRFVLFGNDGYSENARVPEYVEGLRGWLTANGYSHDAPAACAEGYTWVIELPPDALDNPAMIEDVRDNLNDKVWFAWELLGGARSADFIACQRAIADAETGKLGGGYRDGFLNCPVNRKAGPVGSGESIFAAIALQQAAGNEDVHVLLGGVPYPAKIVHINRPLGVPTDIPYTVPPVGIEGAVMLESVGDPRSEAEPPSEAFIARGGLVIVKDSGEVHITTGRRLMVSADPFGNVLSN